MSRIPRKAYKEPTKRELEATPAQRKLLLYAVICIVLSLLCAYLGSQGVPIKVISIIMCILACITAAIYIITILNDGFVATGKYVIRDSSYFSEYLLRLVLALIIIIVITAIVYQ